MADSKISALTALATTPASGDLLVLVDISDTTMAASGTNKKITFSDLTSTFLTSSTGLLATGATTGATSQAQTFTNGVIIYNPSTIANLRMDNGVSIGGGYSQLQFFANSSQSAANQKNFSVVNTNPVSVGGENYLEFHARNDNATVKTVLFSITHAGIVSVGTAQGAMKFNVFGALGTFAAPVNTDTEQMRLGRSDSPTIRYHSVHTYHSSTAGLNYVRFNVHDASTTTAQTTAMSIHGDGRVYIGGAVAPTAVLHVAASTTARASLCVVAGTAPTTPVVGDIWNDGALSFYNADATTNAVVNHLRLSRDSTGTPAAGLGLGILAELESTTTSRQSAGRLIWAWSTATHASRAAVGKLTAYYTSTEREAITWIADSTEGKVGINGTPSTHALEITSAGTGAIKATSATTGTSLFSGGQAIDLHSSNYTGGMGFLHSSNTSSVIQAYKAASEDADLLLNPNGGNVGLGVVTPAGKLHGYDGSGGFLFVNRTGVDSTLVTVIPDGTGDVTERLHMFGWVSNSAGGFVSQVNEVYLDVSSSTTKTDGSNTLTIAVTAGGAFTLQTTLGSATWKVLLWVFWR